MKSVDKKDFAGVGVLVKTHGIKGEFKLSLNVPQEITEKEWVMLEIQAKPVPFFVESIRYSSPDEAIVKLRGVDSISEASEFLGFRMLLPKNMISNPEAFIDNHLLGYMLIDAVAGALGELHSLHEMPTQTLFETTFHGKQCLIPAVREFISFIDERKKEIHLRLPEGLL